MLNEDTMRYGWDEGNLNNGQRCGGNISSESKRDTKKSKQKKKKKGAQNQEGERKQACKHSTLSSGS